MSPEALLAAARVLVTGAGGPSAVAVMRSLDAAGATVLAADIDPFAAGLYLVDGARRSIVPRGDDPGFVDAIHAYCVREGVRAVVPTVDSELIPLAEQRDRFAADGIALVLASEATLRMCLDKWELFRACAGGEVEVPRTLLVDETFDAAAPPLPVIVKPRTGSGSRDIRLVAARDELERLERDGSLLVQELLPGPEHSLDVLADADGRILAVVPRARLKLDSGIAVTGRTLHDEALERIGAQVATRIALTGVANVQVKENAGGEPALLEVNPRFLGTMPLTIASGIDMPALCVAATLGATLPEGPLAFADVAMVRYLEDRFFDPAQLESMEAVARELAVAAAAR